MSFISKLLGLNRVSFVFILITVFNFMAYGAGEVDTSFSAAAYNIENTGVNTIATQADGKIIVGGSFVVANTTARHGLARLNTDGTVDTSFNPPVFFSGTTLGANILVIAFQSNGKILVGGNFSIIGSSLKSLVRLNSDGSLDSSFTSFAMQSQNNADVRRIIVLPDDTFVAYGEFLVFNQTASTQQIAKFDANGNFNPAFRMTNVGAPLTDIAVQPDGKVLLCAINLQRQNTDGSLDNTFPVVTTNGGISRMILRPDGKILIGGSFTTVNGFSQNRIALVNANGSLDLTFNQNGIGATGGGIGDIILVSDGKIYISGSFTQYNGVAKNKIAKLNADGTLDNSLNYTPLNSNTFISDLNLLSNGKLMIAGGQTATATDLVSRINADGSPDSSFSVKFGRNGYVKEILQQPDGKILIGGRFTLVNGTTQTSFARLNLDGTVDSTFTPYFNNGGLLGVESIALQPDGKILVGFYGSFGLIRMNPDGSRDTSFLNPFTNGGSVIYDLAVLPDGKILVGGLISENLFVRRLNSNGSIDNGFNLTQPNGIVNKIKSLNDGKFYLCGDFTQVAAMFRGRVARFNADGSFDNSFNPPGGANAGIFDCDVQSDGKLIVGGYFSALNGSANHQFIGRLNTDGSLDTSFAQTVGGVTPNAQITTLKIQPDNKILIGGIFTQVGGIARSNLARLNANGTLDATFNPSATAQVNDINLQTDGKILLGGSFTQISGFSALTVARLLNSSAPVRTLFDFDGDGRADVSVFRPSENKWYILRSSDGQITQQIFAISGDIPTPADFDGDGRADMSIFRPSSGDWWSLSSINNNQVFTHWGANGDIPRPSDFDGDGRADYIVFRAAENNWYRISSATGLSSTRLFGSIGDKPVSGDFDGDGKSDVAIYRPSTGEWWWQSSVDNIQRATRWGISSDIPAPADFDGDGKTDFAVYRPSTGVWYIINSANGSFTIINFGLAEDKPIPADYDGDGRADIAVFRPSTGIWYLLRSTSGFAALQFGISTDIPTPNAFVP